MSFLNRLLQYQIKNYHTMSSFIASSKLLKFASANHNLTNKRNKNSDKEWDKYIENEKKYGKLVYKSRLESQLFRAKILSLSSSIIGIGIIPFLITSLKDASILANILVFGTSSFFILATPVLFQYVTRRHVNRMHYNSETDTFTVFLYNFFLMEYKLVFKASDILVPDLPGMFTSFKIKNLNRSLFVDYDQVTDKSIVVRILGFDKPIDINKYDNKNKDDDDD